MLVSSASAGQTVVNKVTITPTYPTYNQGFYLTIYVANPPVGGYVRCMVGDNTWTPDLLLSSTGVTATPQEYITNIEPYPPEPPIYSLWVFDANGNIVATANGFIPIDESPYDIPEFPSVVVPVVAVLGMLAIIGRRKE